MQLNFIPEPVSQTLLDRIKQWNDQLPLLRGDNIYDISRLFFSSKGWDAQQAHLTADIAHGKTGGENDRHIQKVVLEDILKPQGLRFMRTLMGRLIISGDEVIGAFVNPSTSATQAKYDVIGTEAFVEYFRTKFKELVDTGVTPHLRRLTLNDKSIATTIETIPPIGVIKDHTLFYPYFGRTPAEVWDAFAKSRANVLVLIGPPGTGKSNFILQMMDHRGWDDKISMIDRQDVLMNPSLSDYIRGCPAGSVVICEDADRLLMARDLGNDLMSAVLNAAEGIVSRDTKIIFSTNLESLSGTDEALTRPGRCFDVLRFKTLSAQQAHDVRAMMDLDAVEMDDKTMTLAKALNYHEMHEARIVKRTGVGFTI